MRVAQRLLFTVCLYWGCEAPALSASLQVSPVSLEIVAPSKASQFTLNNLGNTATDVQVRVYSWTQQGGQEQLTPTTDVVASPPAAHLTPGQDYTVRVVRVTDKPIEGEETYRLLIDELPPLTDETQSNVKFIYRYSIPVFFSQGGMAQQLTWVASSTKNKINLTAHNDGAHHIRISTLMIQDQSGSTISFGDGLVGYVLPHSTARWNARVHAKNIAAGTTIKITAQGNNGPITATAVVQGAN